MRSLGRASRRRPAMAAWLALALAELAAGVSGARVAPARVIAVGSAGLAYSSASAHSVQRQPARGSCRAHGSGIYAQPDPR